MHVLAPLVRKADRRSPLIMCVHTHYIPVASEGDKSRGGAKGAAPGRVREGGTPPAQLGGMGERCELPHRGLGRSPRSQRFLLLKNSKNYTKTRRPRKRPRPLLHIYKYRVLSAPTKKMARTSVSS